MGSTKGNGLRGVPLWKKGAARALRLAGLLALVAVIGGLLLPLLDTQPAQLSAYSEHWNDLSELRGLVKEFGITSRSILTGPKELSKADPHKSLLVIIGVERSYSSEETSAISRFLYSGGGLLLADDFGHGDELLRSIAYDRIRIRSDCLRDIRYLKNPDFVRVMSRPNTLELPVRELLLNRPAALEIGPGAPLYRYPTVLVNASPHAWLDSNRNLERDPDEREYPYPVMAIFSYEGVYNVVVASDPGLFVNDMMVWNREFVRALLGRLTLDRTDVLFDESRHNPEGAAEKLGTGLLRSASGYAGNPLALFLTFLFVFLIFGYQYFTLPAPAPRRHRDALDRPRLLHFVAPWVSINEFRRLRVAVVERVRLAYGYSPEDFYPAMLSAIPELLGDPELQRFLEYETYPDMMAFQMALYRGFAWRPPAQTDGWYDPSKGREGAGIEYAEVEVVEEGREALLDIDGLMSGPTGGGGGP